MGNFFPTGSGGGGYSTGSGDGGSSTRIRRRRRRRPQASFDGDYRCAGGGGSATGVIPLLPLAASRRPYPGEAATQPHANADAGRFDDEFTT